MAAIHLQTTVNSDGTLMIKDLPSLAGRSVSVVIRENPQESPPKEPYPLRGQPFQYAGPFDSVAENDWGGNCSKLQ